MNIDVFSLSGKPNPSWQIYLMQEIFDEMRDVFGSLALYYWSATSKTRCRTDTEESVGTIRVEATLDTLNCLRTVHAIISGTTIHPATSGTPIWSAHIESTKHPDGLGAHVSLVAGLRDQDDEDVRHVVCTYLTSEERRFSNVTRGWDYRVGTPTRPTVAAIGRAASSYLDVLGKIRFMNDAEEAAN